MRARDVQVLRRSHLSLYKRNKQVGRYFATFLALNKKIKRDCETHITAKKNETARPVKFSENFARPKVFKGPFATPNKTQQKLDNIRVNIPQFSKLRVLRKTLKDNHYNSLNLARK